MRKNRKYNFSKVNVRPEVKQEIEVLAALHQRPIYDLVGEMLEDWKIAHNLVGVSCESIRASKSRDIVPLAGVEEPV
ncbi:MAG: hypothetical protein JW963_25040 [Anaerolineales bacterium]|nr:hypothetical protein [Anaerolineales bacterium]